MTDAAERDPSLADLAEEVRALAGVAALGAAPPDAEGRVTSLLQAALGPRLEALEARVASQIEPLTRVAADLQRAEMVHRRSVQEAATEAALAAVETSLMRRLDRLEALFQESRRSGRDLQGRLVTALAIALAIGALTGVLLIGLLPGLGARP